MKRPIRVIFLFQGLTPYTNALLNKLNAVDGLHIQNVVPTHPTSLEPGVHVSKEGVGFKVHEREEYHSRFGDLFFRGLWRILLVERPDIVVTTIPHLRDFFFHPLALLAMKLARTRLVLKSIPFRTPLWPELRERAFHDLAQALQAAPRRIRRGEEIVMRWPAPMRWPGQALLRWARWMRNRMAVWRCEAGLASRRLLWRLPDAHITYVEAGRGVYGSYGVPRSRIFPVYNSPDTDVLLAVLDGLRGAEDRPTRSGQRLVHVGRLTAWKRVDLLLEAMAALIAEYPGLEGLIVGDGPERQNLEQRAGKLGIAGSVRFVGGVYEPKALGRLLLSSDVYVLAGMGGLSINEAMCFELPVVCSVCDGTEKHLVRDGWNGLFFREGDASDLTEKIRVLLASREMRERMGRNSLRIIRDEMNIHTVIRCYLQCFNALTGRSLHEAPAARPCALRA